MAYDVTLPSRPLVLHMLCRFCLYTRHGFRKSMQPAWTLMPCRICLCRFCTISLLYENMYKRVTSSNNKYALWERCIHFFCFCVNSAKRLKEVGGRCGFLLCFCAGEKNDYCAAWPNPCAAGQINANIAGSMLQRTPIWPRNGIDNSSPFSPISQKLLLSVFMLFPGVCLSDGSEFVRIPVCL